MKRLFALLLAVSMMLALYGCGATANNGADTKETTLPVTQAPADVDLQELYDSLAEKMPEMILLDKDMMFNFCGIAPEDYTEAAVATCADGLRTDEIWLIKAADEAALEKLKGMAEIRLQMKGEESITYSPEQYAVVQEAELFSEGLYLVLIVSPDVDVLTEMARDAIA